LIASQGKCRQALDEDARARRIATKEQTVLTVSVDRQDMSLREPLQRVELVNGQISKRNKG
jgi:hypothetical protein